MEGVSDTEKTPLTGGHLTDQPGTSFICNSKLIGSIVVNSSSNVQVDQSHSTIINQDSKPEKKLQETFMQGIQVIKADYREIERIKKTFQWNDELNLDLEEDYLMQRLTLTKRGQNPSAFTTLSTTDLMEELQKQKRHRIFIEGDFSTGKTTLCRYIFYQWMCGELRSFTLVMWISLRDLHGRSILEALAESFMEKSKVFGVNLEEFQAFLTSEGEKILLLLDGIDEAHKEQESVFGILQRDTLPYTSIIATSRPISKDIPLDCRRYIVEGISENDVKSFLSSKLEKDAVKIILRQVSVDILRRPLMLKFVAILAKHGEKLTDIPTAYHVYHKLVLHAVKKYAKKYPEDDSVKSKKIHDVAKHFTDQLGPIAFECLNQGTLRITKERLIEHYKLTGKDIEDQGKIGLVSFYNVVTKCEIDEEEEVCEFPLQPFSEMFAVQYLKDLLVRGDSRVKDLHALFRVSSRCILCGSHIGDDELVQGLWIHSRPLIIYLFTLLNDYDEICAKVFQYFLSRCVCRCERIFLVENMHNRPGVVINLDMNESVLVVILGHLTGQSKHKCCQRFLRTLKRIWAFGNFHRPDSPFSNGLRPLILKSYAVPVSFCHISALLSTVTCYLQEQPSAGRVIDQLKSCLEVIDKNKSSSDVSSPESILSLSPYSDVLRTITKHVRVLLLPLAFMKSPFTARTTEMIEWLASTFDICVVEIKIGPQLLPDIRNIQELLVGCSTKTNLQIRFAHNIKVMFLEDGDVHSVFFEEGEGRYEFQRCEVCAIGRRFVRTRSEAVVVNENIGSFEDVARDSRAKLAATKPTCVGFETHGKAFYTTYMCQFQNVYRYIPCSCGGSFRLDSDGCSDVCACSRRGFVNDSGLFRVQLKCSSCGTIRHERCCDMEHKLSCPHCHKDLDDNDFQSGLLLKMSCDLMLGNSLDDLMLLSDFSCCPSCRSPTRQLLRCPSCARNILHAEGVAPDLSQSDTLKVQFFVRCMFCQDWMVPGVCCENDQCQYFNVGLVSKSAREWRRTLQCFHRKVDRENSCQIV